MNMKGWHKYCIYRLDGLGTICKYEAREKACRLWQKYMYVLGTKKRHKEKKDEITATSLINENPVL